jgi:hypothetical protein
MTFLSFNIHRGARMAMIARDFEKLECSGGGWLCQTWDLLITLVSVSISVTLHFPATNDLCHSVNSTLSLLSNKEALCLRKTSSLNESIGWKKNIFGRKTRS